MLKEKRENWRQTYEIQWSPALGIVKHRSPPTAAIPAQAQGERVRNELEVFLLNWLGGLMLNCISPVSHQSTPVKGRLRRNSEFKALSHCLVPAFHLHIVGRDWKNIGVP
ncbi:hypothetical protein HAX54_008892 [Datura stramonium]|uniref:Uncharacterized protein n=1 Tax=Datura stramonium TaxID=4076 RepID=A0ABS8TE21_DATST|nr:hypothetical protein [Datura stramonium]